MRFFYAVLLLTIVALGVGCGPVRTECSVKVVGRNASVTVQGLFAGRTCGEILKNPQNVFGNLPEPLNGGQNWFEPTQPPQEPQVCIYNVSGQTFIVRDYGVFNILGSFLCQALSVKAK